VINFIRMRNYFAGPMASTFGAKVLQKLVLSVCLSFAAESQIGFLIVLVGT